MSNNNNPLHGVILKASDCQIQGKKVILNPNKTKGVPGMLLIHGLWCHFCVKFHDTFNKISDKIGKDFCCASIESEELKGQDALTAALDFQGFPTICFFNQDGMITSQYDGNRDKKSILDAICKTYHKCYQ
jgi:thiol-disulfide isomerase/thioredoxin